jgi:selT/selW/selH-like putative selenoprotein
VADKGYHSGPVLKEMKAAGVRTYIPEKKQAGKRHWVGKEEERDVVYANRQRLQRPKGKRLLRKRGELIERTFAHCYETGGMRRTHLRKHNNILKRLLIHVAGMNLGLLLRNKYGIGTPRGLQGLSHTLDFLVTLIAQAIGLEGSCGFRRRKSLIPIWLLRAAWMAQELLTTFQDEIGEVALIPGTGGVFEVRVDGESIWSRQQQGTFPEIKQLKQLVRDRVAPGKELGHSDRP